MSRTRPPALILGLSGNGLGVARSLASVGVDVHGIYRDPLAEVGRHSRVLRSTHRVKHPASDDDVMAVLLTLRRTLGTMSKPVIVPANDIFAGFVSTHRAELGEHFLCSVAPPDVHEAFIDKRKALEICRRNGMPIPRSSAPTAVEDVAREGDRMRFPVIIKPARTFDRGFPGKNVVVGSLEELLAFYRKTPRLVRRTVFQELVPSGDGRIVGVSSYSSRDASVLAMCSSRKLRQWVPDVGSGCFSVSETMPDLMASMRAFLERVGYVGFASAEFAEDARTGERLFLELNVRTNYRNRLSADAGVDLSAIGYLDMIGERPAPGGPQHDGVYWIDLHRDIPCFAVKWSRREITFAEWWRSIRSASSFAIYDRHDVRPFLAALARMAAIGAGLVTGKQPASLRPILKRVFSRHR